MEINQDVTTVLALASTIWTAIQELRHWYTAFRKRKEVK